MANRPYFYTDGNVIRKANADFEWFPGFAVVQKQKSIDSFHSQIKMKNKNPLEISTKSKSLLGQKLSAFNLKLDGIFLENIFQSSKVFENGGPFLDLLKVHPKNAKNDQRLKESGRLIAFRYHDVDFPLEPKTLFYDYIYYHAVRECITSDELEELNQYDSFTDIEFNPNRSINTQARSIAMVSVIYKLNGDLPNLSKTEFLKRHLEIVCG